MNNYKYFKLKFLLLIFIFLIFFSHSFNILSQNQIVLLRKDRIEFQEAYQNKNKYYIIEYFFNEKLEYIVARYYIKQFLLPIFIKKGFKPVDINKVIKPPEIKMANMMPTTINYKVFRELYYQIIKEGSYDYNYQILAVFSKKFGTKYLIRLFEFKLYYKERNPSTFISGGVLLNVTDTEFKIIKEF